MIYPCGHSKDSNLYLLTNSTGTEACSTPTMGLRTPGRYATYVLSSVCGVMVSSTIQCLLSEPWDSLRCLLLRGTADMYSTYLVLCPHTFNLLYICISYIVIQARFFFHFLGIFFLIIIYITIHIHCRKYCKAWRRKYQLPQYPKQPTQRETHPLVIS